MPSDALLVGYGCSPAPTKAMALLEGQHWFVHSTPVLIASAMVSSTWLCPHLYYKCLCAAAEDLFHCSSLGTQQECWWLCYAPGLTGLEAHILPWWETWSAEAWLSQLNSTILSDLPVVLFPLFCKLLFPPLLSPPPELDGAFLFLWLCLFTKVMSKITQYA